MPVSTRYACRVTRARARGGGALSAPVTVYAWPNVKFGKIRWAGRTHLRVTHRVTTPGTDLRGQRLVMYLDRRRTESMTRIASGPLRRAGRWCTTATMRFRPPRKVGERDYLYVCVQGGLRRGLGAPTNLTRRCGVRSIRE